MGNEIKIGSVVRFSGRRRNFVVCDEDCTGTLYLIALSGAFRGAAPNVRREALELVSGARVQFSGKQARYLCNRYTQAMARHGGAR